MSKTTWQVVVSSSTSSSPHNNITYQTSMILFITILLYIYSHINSFTLLLSLHIDDDYFQKIARAQQGHFNDVTTTPVQKMRARKRCTAMQQKDGDTIKIVQGHYSRHHILLLLFSSSPPFLFFSFTFILSFSSQVLAFFIIIISYYYYYCHYFLFFIIQRCLKMFKIYIQLYTVIVTPLPYILYIFFFPPPPSSSLTYYFYFFSPRHYVIQPYVFIHVQLSHYREYYTQRHIIATQ